MRRLAAIAVVAAYASGFAGTAHAQALVDPTRPPYPAAADEEPGGKAAARPQLQSVLISPTRRIAIISGQTVRQGDKHGDATVVRIGVSEVFLRRGDDTEVLKLTPAVDTKASRPPGRGAQRGGG
jgi:MSHA biogenesis protein MshK